LSPIEQTRKVRHVLCVSDLADLTGSIQEQLGRFGVAGRVELDGSTLRLIGHGRSIAIEFTEIDTWPSASPALRARIVERIAREIVRARRAQAGLVSTRSHSVEWLRLLSVVVVVGGGIGLAWKWLGRPARDAAVATMSVRQTAASAPPALPIAVNAQSPLERCQRVQGRIATGGNVSSLDVDGWVVELMLLSTDPTFGPTSDKLDPFLAKSEDAGTIRRLIWTEDDELRTLDGADSFVIVSSEPLIDVVAGTKTGVRIAWTGKYVGKYFDQTSRARMQRLAAAIYEATGAMYGALYARCAVGAIHQVGSWFRGQDLATATLSLVAAMGMYAEVAHVEGLDPRTTGPIDQRRAWDGLVERVRKLDRQRVTLTLAEEGGMIASRPGSWVTLSFPFQDANRATRTSLRIARAVGVAPRR
jgi:hypothetical protein